MYIFLKNFIFFRYGFKKTFKYNQIEEWLRSNINEWPVLSKPKIQTKETVTTPKSSFPFTVEVIHDEACNPGDNMEQIRNFNFSLELIEVDRLMSFLSRGTNLVTPFD